MRYQRMAKKPTRAKRMAWTSDKAARAEGLRRRREEMVLEARRKMLEKDAAA